MNSQPVFVTLYSQPARARQSSEATAVNHLDALVVRNGKLENQSALQRVGRTASTRLAIRPSPAQAILDSRHSSSDDLIEDPDYLESSEDRESSTDDGVRLRREVYQAKKTRKAWKKSLDRIDKILKGVDSRTRKRDSALIELLTKAEERVNRNDNRLNYILSHVEQRIKENNGQAHRSVCGATINQWILLFLIVALFVLVLTGCPGAAPKLWGIRSKKSDADICTC